MNQLILGDNLEIMRKMDSETIDLIYLDPPFFSNRNYEVIWGDKGEIRSFEDRWSGGINQYILWLKERVIQMHRILKTTGSIYLHCDWHADSYIRVHILDRIFGKNNFINQIIWCYETGGRGSNFYPRKHDIIYFYSKDNKKKKFNDKFIRCKRDTSTMHEPILTDEQGKEYQRNIKNGKEYRYYLDNGVLPNDYWIDIQALNPAAKERIGYPTQKPEKLMERIILASSDEGDLVLDPFVGGGTTIVAAEKLNRSWIGIDQSVAAVKVTEMRLNKIQNFFSKPFSLQLHKYDYDTLFNMDPFEFEKWIILKFGEKINGGSAIPHAKKGGDKGIDGKTRDGTPIQVKQSENIGVNIVKNFIVSAEQYDQLRFEKNRKLGLPIGYIVAFSFGKGAIQETARLQNDNNVIIKLLTVDEIVPIAKRPKLFVTLNDLGCDAKGFREIEFNVKAESDSGIEFFSWDFEYNEIDKKFNPSVIFDKEGKQIHKFVPGIHTISVKGIDNEGMEALEVINVKINGMMKVDF
ncbi:MAG: hypothetical protein QG635_1558 [Bacteroidota bacterium]|nr:hypothetical protein [Bacteroidota bacterium]